MSHLTDLNKNGIELENSVLVILRIFIRSIHWTYYKWRIDEMGNKWNKNITCWRNYILNSFENSARCVDSYFLNWDFSSSRVAVTRVTALSSVTQLSKIPLCVCIFKFTELDQFLFQVLRQATPQLVHAWEQVQAATTFNLYKIHYYKANVSGIFTRFISYYPIFLIKQDYEESIDPLSAHGFFTSY